MKVGDLFEFEGNRYVIRAVLDSKVTASKVVTIDGEEKPSRGRPKTFDFDVVARAFVEQEDSPANEDFFDSSEESTMPEVSYSTESETDSEW